MQILTWVPGTSAYGAGAEGLLALYTDCHVGFLLHNGSRTWSLMLLERAQEQKQLKWRENDASIKTHVKKLKEIYYEIWRRISLHQGTGLDQAAALTEVTCCLC